MAWISIENLGLYHQKLKEWFSKQSISATKIIQDETHKFVTSEQVKKWDNSAAEGSKTTVIQFCTELPVGHNTINIEKQYSITENNVLLFIDGIKLIKNKHYTVDTSKNSLIIKQLYENSADVEVMIFI